MAHSSAFGDTADGSVSCHNVFWTGGWDSTFRVIELARSGNIVQPHYLVDPRRKSTRNELQAIEKIAGLIEARYPGVLRTVLIRNSNEIPVGQHIYFAYEAVLRDVFIGAQYTWLAAYWEETGIRDFELSIPVHLQGGVGLHRVISPHLRPVSDGIYRLRDDTPEPLMTLFGNCIFPMLGLTKGEMKKTAERWGDSDILEHSWFCHTPLLGRYACGTCGPCVIAIQDGLGYRVPLFGRMRYHLRIYARLKSAMRRFPRIYRYGTMLKHRRFPPA